MLQVIETGACACGDTHDRRGSERRGREALAHLRADELQPFVVDQVTLGQHDHPMLHFEQVEDMEVFLGLRH